MKRILTLLTLVVLSATLSAQATPNPVIVVETEKGNIEIEFNPRLAPKGVAQIMKLVEKNFYRSFRVHRVTPSLVQFGDPLTRNALNKDRWGSGGSGTRVGVAEITPSMKHLRGVVGFAYSGEAKFADSQLYIMKVAMPGLDGDYSILGRVTKGLTIVDQLQVSDLIKNVTVKGSAAK